MCETAAAVSSINIGVAATVSAATQLQQQLAAVAVSAAAASNFNVITNKNSTTKSQKIINHNNSPLSQTTKANAHHQFVFKPSVEENVLLRFAATATENWTSDSRKDIHKGSGTGKDKIALPLSAATTEDSISHHQATAADDDRPDSATITVKTFAGGVVGEQQQPSKLVVGFAPPDNNIKERVENNNIVGGGGSVSSAFGTIINESDFPHLGVRWSPSFSGSSGGDGGGVNISSSYGSVVGASATSPMVSMHGGLVSTTTTSTHLQQPHQHPTSLQNALFSRETGVHVNRPYANLIRDSIALHERSNEFRIQNEDFPALPGGGSGFRSGSVTQKNGDSSNSAMYDGVNASEQGGGNLRGFSAESMDDQMSVKTGIQTHSDGLVTNIPPNMLNDQYGMAGLLTFLRTIESEPSIVALALGHDLTNLGLNLNSAKRNLYQTFGGPWADYPCRIQDLDVRVPEEYLTNATIRDKLPNIKMNKFSDDVLFYLFYNCPGEVYQVAAASELYQRDWRFHKADRVWLTRSPFTNPPFEHTGSYEKSSYNVFDPIQWRKIPKEMLIEYKQLDTKPGPASASGAGASATNAPAGFAAMNATNCGMPPPPGRAGGMMGMQLASGAGFPSAVGSGGASSQPMLISAPPPGMTGNSGVSVSNNSNTGVVSIDNVTTNGGGGGAASVASTPSKLDGGMEPSNNARK